MLAIRRLCMSWAMSRKPCSIGMPAQVRCANCWLNAMKSSARSGLGRSDGVCRVATSMFRTRSATRPAVAGLCPRVAASTVPAMGWPSGVWAW